MKNDNLSKDLLSSQEDFEIEQINYHGSVSMPKSHYHQHYEILYVYSGERILQIDYATKFCLNSSNICLVKPYVIHSTTSYTTSYQSRFLINISPKFVEELCEDLSPTLLTCFNTIILPLSRSDAGIINFMFQSLISLDKSHSDYKYSVKIILSHMLLYLSNIYHSQNIPNKMTNYTSHELRIQEVLKYINEHYSENLTEEFMSDIAGLNSQYFCRIFKQYAKISPISYLNSVRILNAKKMLAGKGTSLESISLSCGFNSVSNFCRVFKRIEGITPTEYKNSINNSQTAL